MSKRRLSKFFGFSKDSTSNSNNQNEKNASVAPTPTLIQSRFPNIKINCLDIHPVKPWILFAEKFNSKTGQLVYLYDYEQNDIVHSFSILSLFEQRKEEIQLIKSLEKNYKNLTLPEWYYSELQTGDSQDVLAAASSDINSIEKSIRNIGELKGLRLFDEDVVHWKLHFDKEREDLEGVVKRNSSSVKTLSNVRKRLSFVHGSMTSLNADVTSKTEQNHSKSPQIKTYQHSKAPRCIVLQMENKLLMMRYDELSGSNMFVFDEIKQSQLDNKSIVCFEFIYTQPLIALGCSDGGIRLWNYADKSKIKAIHPHQSTKCGAIQKIIAIHRDDALNSFPSLLSAAADGSLSSWNVEKGVSEFFVQKTHESGTIVDFIYDSETGTITSLGSDKTICIRNSSSGVTIAKQKMSGTKGMKTLCQVTSSNCIPSWYLLSGNSSTKICRISSDLAKETWDESLDVASMMKVIQKKPKFYLIKVHPLCPNIIFCGSNFGLHQFKLDYNKTPSVALSYEVEKLPPPPSTATITTNGEPSPSTVNVTRSIYYLKDRILYQRIINHSSQIFGNPSKALNLKSLGNTQVLVCSSGRFLAIYWEADKEFVLYRTDNWSVIATNSNVLSFHWCPYKDRYAILKQVPEENKRYLGIFDMINCTVSSVIDKIPLNYHNSVLDPVKLFGGKWIGISTQSKDENGLIFLDWNGSLIDLPNLLPKPRFIVWDIRYSGMCLMAFSESYAVFSYQPEFKLICYMKEELESALWWNGTLFTVTKTEIKCVFINHVSSLPSSRHEHSEEQNITSVLLATFDMGPYTSLFANGREEDSIDPIPQPRPKGSITLIDVVGDNLYCMDSLYTLHSISLEYPSLKFRILTVANRIEQALSWVPYIPPEIHDYLVDFMCDRGYTQEACSPLFSLISPSKRFELCLTHGYMQEAFQTLEDYYGLSLLSHERSKLYIRLASHCIKAAKNTTLAEQCFLRAVELHEQGSLKDLITFYAKFGKRSELESLRQRLSAKNSTQYQQQEDNFSEELALICLFLGDKKQSAAKLSDNREHTMSITMKESIGEPVDDDVDKLRVTLTSSYPHMVPLKELATG